LGHFEEVLGHIEEVGGCLEIETVDEDVIYDASLVLQEVCDNPVQDVS